MIKKTMLILLCFYSLATQACPRATATDDPNFCASFKTAAVCHCTSSGLPTGMCQNLPQLYSRMISFFGTLKKACDFQKQTTSEDCINNWNCYLHGGIDSTGKSCSSTQLACPS